MNEIPLVTIAVPFFNPGNYFIDCLKSIFAQTFTDWELLLINDGSTDNSLELALSINDPRVQVIGDEENRGLVYRLNQISKIARGKYIARMDADDIMHPSRIEKQFLYLESHPDVDLVDTGAYILNKKRNIVGVRGLSNIAFTSYNIFKTGLILHPSIMAKRIWFIKNQYNDTYERAEDRELFVRCIKTSSIKHIYEPLFYYYIGNIRLEAYLKSYQSERKVIIKYGPEIIGLKYSIFLFIRSLLKSCLLKPLVAFRMDYWITKNAFQPIPEDMINYSLEIKNKIYDITIPC